MTNSKISRNIAIVLLIYFTSFMLISPHKSIDSAISSINLCGRAIIPTLFPFIFCSNLFISLGVPEILSRHLSKYTYRIFGVSGAGTIAIILGLLCGYPVGAICASSMYNNGECSKNEAERLISFCNNAGPMFIISVIGTGYLSSYKTGVILYLIHITSAILYGFMMKFFRKEKSSRILCPVRDENDFKEAVFDIGNSITQSIETILKICGFIIIFAVVGASIPESPYKAYIHPVLEISAGIKALIENNHTQYTLPLISAFLSLSGISVLAQVSSVTVSSGLSLRPYITGKTIQSVISFILTLLYIKICPQSIPAFSSTVYYHIPDEKELIYLSMITFIAAIIAIVIMLITAKIAERFDK